MTNEIHYSYHFREFGQQQSSRFLDYSISPHGLAGIQGFLAVVRALAQHDDMACIALCENSKWGSLHNLLSLVSCSFDISLKTDLLLTLAALGKLKETALQLWFNLETSQIIETIPLANAFSTVPCCLESETVMEIVKTESRNEIYPLTQAILELLYTLSSTIMPKHLGAGSRKPGIYPYFNFVLKSIFFKLCNRYATKMSLFFNISYVFSTLYLRYHLQNSQR